MTVHTHINYGVSITDVIKHPVYSKLSKDSPDPMWECERTLNRVLWDFGIDTSLAVTPVECTHRNLQKEVVTTIMYRGAERTDKSWLTSGCASIEAVKYSTSDKSLRNELNKIQNQK